MRKTLFTLFLTLVSIAAWAQAPAPQVTYPRPSQHAVLTQTIGTTDMTITYSRPGVKGRTIWGGLVPYDKVWRTGANEATKISFSDDVTINGQALPKGTYSLHTIPGKDQWTIIFNKVADQWGSFKYDQAQDALRVTAKPHGDEFNEWMTFSVPSLSTDSATVEIKWANLAVPFTIGTNSTQKTLAAARAGVAAAGASDWRTPNRAASYAFDAGDLTDAQAWSDQAVRANENINTLWLKARLLQKHGQIADAVRTGEMAIAKAGPNDAELVSEIRAQLDTWKK